MRWLVTGGCGFIGLNLIAALLRDSNNLVRIIDNGLVGTPQDLASLHKFVALDPETLAAKGTPRSQPQSVELVSGDIRDSELARRATAGMDVVVHLAANTGVGPSVDDPVTDCTTNVLGTLSCLEACRHNNVRRFVFASSGAPVGNCEPPIHEELPAHPVSPYGASKLAGEAYCSAYKHCFAIDAVALRFGNCYGPRSSHKASIVAKFIRQAIVGEAWEIYGDGRQTRDFIYVGDIVTAIMKAAVANSIGGEVFQIATNSETTVEELAVRLAAALQRNGITPPQIRRGKPRTGDVARNYSDTRKARACLGWQAQTTLDVGLSATVKWFLNRN